MTIVVYLIPIAIFLGVLGLTAFIWSVRSGQFDDLEGATHRILIDDDDRPAPEPVKRMPDGKTSTAKET